MIFKTIKPLSVHIARHQSIWAQLVFKTITSNRKEVSNTLRTSKRRRRRKMHKREEGKHWGNNDAKVLHCTSTRNTYTCIISIYSPAPCSNFMHQLQHAPPVPR
jgi:hypothetical protein